MVGDSHTVVADSALPTDGESRAVNLACRLHRIRVRILVQLGNPCSYRRPNGEGKHSLGVGAGGGTPCLVCYSTVVRARLASALSTRTLGRHLHGPRVEG